jgi:hypothetical protein
MPYAIDIEFGCDLRSNGHTHGFGLNGLVSLVQST